MISTTTHGRLSRLTIVIAAITVVSCGGKQAVAPPAATPEVAPAPATASEQMGKVAVGYTVAAPFVGSSLYLARVKSISGEDAFVHFGHDDSEDTYPVANLRAIEVRTWAVGDSVLAVADKSSGRFSEGRVKAVTSPGIYTIANGDFAPKDVEAKYIIAP